MRTLALMEKDLKEKQIWLDCFFSLEFFDVSSVPAMNIVIVTSTILFSTDATAILKSPVMFGPIWTLYRLLPPPLLLPLPREPPLH